MNDTYSRLFAAIGTTIDIIIAISEIINNND